VGFEPTVGL